MFYYSILMTFCHFCVKNLYLNVSWKLVGTRYRKIAHGGPPRPSLNFKILIFYPILYETSLFQFWLRNLTKWKIFTNWDLPILKFKNLHLLSDFRDILYEKSHCLNVSWNWTLLEKKFKICHLPPAKILKSSIILFL